MPNFLPPNLMALFAPRDPLRYLPPPDELPFEKKTSGYSGVSSFLENFEDPKDTPPPNRIETLEEREERKRKEKAEQVAYKLEQDIALWAPRENPASTIDPYKTLFVARVNYDTSESKLRREFEAFGPIKKIAIVHDKQTGRPRGYAFIEYEHERDMRSAYKRANGKKIDGRRVIVDIERGRTVKGWLPRRLGGGLGETRRNKSEVNVNHSDQEVFVPEGRYMEPERSERPERRCSRSRSRERRRRNRSRSKERHHDRHKRELSRHRERGHNRQDVMSVDNGDVSANIGNIAPEMERKERRHGRDHKRRRSRSRDRDCENRKRRRSRSRGDRKKRREYDQERDLSRLERSDRDDGVQDENQIADISQNNFNNVNYEDDFNN